MSLSQPWDPTSPKQVPGNYSINPKLPKVGASPGYLSSCKHGPTALSSIWFLFQEICPLTTLNPKPHQQRQEILRTV